MGKSHASQYANFGSLQYKPSFAYTTLLIDMVFGITFISLQNLPECCISESSPDFQV